MIVKYTNLAKRFAAKKSDYISAFESVIESGQFIGGNSVSNFEQGVANFLNIKHVAGVGSGTDALYLMLKYYDFPAASEIITVPNSYLASVSTIFLNDLTPIYAEINPKTLQMDVNSVEKLIGPKTVGIMAVHLMGSPCEVDKLRKICDKHGIKLFEDFSQSFGAQVAQKAVGTIGDAGACSLHPLKNLPCFGDGGFICTNDRDLYDWTLLARTHGHPHRDECNFWSFNMRLDALQAEISHVNLLQLKNITAKRQKLATIYLDKLSSIPQIQTLSYSSDMTHTFHTFVIIANERDELCDFLKQCDIETVIHYPKLIPELNAHIKVKISHMSKALNSRILSLPISEEHTELEIGFVCEKIKQFYAMGERT